MLKRDNSRRWLWLVLAASVFVRVGGVFYLGDVVDAPPLLTDQRSYHFLAVRLLEGHGCSFDKGLCVHERIHSSLDYLTPAEFEVRRHQEQILVLEFELIGLYASSS
jgi:hypothetical protein